MPTRLNLIDRIRIERMVWALDQRLYDLPSKVRVATRRDVRQNLVAAAHDVGTTAALRQLGSSRELAAEYLAASFGDQPRHSWIATAVCLGTAGLILNWVFGEASNAFADGIAAADPTATGTYTWDGLGWLQSDVEFTFVSGNFTSVGGAWTPLTWGLVIFSAVLVGRLWRIPAGIVRRRTRQTNRQAVTARRDTMT